MRKNRRGSLKRLAVERKVRRDRWNAAAGRGKRKRQCATCAAGRPRVVAKDDDDAAPVRVLALAEDRDVGVGRTQRRQRHAAEPRLIGLEFARASRERQQRQRRDEQDAPHCARARSLKRFCLARLPQTSISHQRRLLFLVVSKNSQPHFSPWHCLTRVRSACCSKVSAESEIGSEHGLDRRLARRPGPAEVAADRRQPAPRERAGVRLGSGFRCAQAKRSGRRRPPRRADRHLRARRAPRASRRAPSASLGAAACASHSASSGAQDARVRGPLGDMLGAPQMILLRVGSRGRSRCWRNRAPARRRPALSEPAREGSSVGTNHLNSLYRLLIRRLGSPR